MKLNFEEAEVLNTVLEGIKFSNKDELKKEIRKFMDHTEDGELKEIYINIFDKIDKLNEAGYKKLVSELPADTISVY